MVLRVKSTVLSIVAPQLETFQFLHDQSLSRANSWTFTRNAGSFQEFITFDKSEKRKNALSLFLSTTTNRVGVNGSHLAGKLDPWWYFEDKDSLEDVVNEMLLVVTEKGLDWFVISATPMPIPSEEVGRDLLENPKGLSTMFQERYKLSISGVVGLEALESLIQENKRDSAEIDWAFIMGAAAFYGETLRTSFGGTWGWDNDFVEPCVIHLGDNPLTKEHLLYRVLRYRTNPYMRLINHYLYLQNAMQMPFAYQPRKKL